MSYEQESKDISFYTGWAIAILFVISVVSWGLWKLYVIQYRDVAPKMQAAERQVYVQTPSYTLGKQQILSKYENEYRKAKDRQSKAAIREEALNEASTIEDSNLTTRNRAFLDELRREQ